MAGLKLVAFLLLIGLSANLLGCSKRFAGDTSFAQANKSFDKQLSGDQRKATIKQLQTETAR